MCIAHGHLYGLMIEYLLHCRSHAVEQHAIQSELQTLVIIAGYACDFLTEGLQALPEDFFTCIEEMKEVL